MPSLWAGPDGAFGHGWQRQAARTMTTANTRLKRSVLFTGFSCLCGARLRCGLFCDVPSEHGRGLKGLRLSCDFSLELESLPPVRQPHGVDGTTGSTAISKGAAA